MNKSQLLFVGGFPSGGTDLLKNVLNAHPNIYINGEMPFMFKFKSYGINPNHTFNSYIDFDQFKSRLKSQDVWNNLENIDEIKFTDFNEDSLGLESFFRNAYNNKQKGVWGNKTPQNTENITYLSQFFPDSKFIVVVRDVRDVVLSWNKKWGKSMLLTAQKWNIRMFNIRYDDNILVIKYEDLITNLEKITKDTCRFLELEWSPRMLEHQKFTENILDGKINYGEKVKSENQNKWKGKLKEKTVKRIEEIAFDGLTKYSYNIEYAKKSKPLTLPGFIFHNVMDIFAMVLIGNRAKTDNSILNRLRELKNQMIIKTK